ncbi:hypothetical protein ACLOJK_032239 [Asimina triloba]
MTTAARPTWAPAKGGQEQGGTRIFGPSQKYSSRDLASHTALKPRYGTVSLLWDTQPEGRQLAGPADECGLTLADKAWLLEWTENLCSDLKARPSAVPLTFEVGLLCPGNVCSISNLAKHILAQQSQLARVSANSSLDLACSLSLLAETLLGIFYTFCIHDTHDELQKRNLREELEERERRHFSSKDKAYDDRDRRKGASTGHLLLEGPKRDAEDRLIPRNVDADDSDVEVKSDDESDDNDDDEDDAEALQAELERIRKERAEEKLRKVKEMDDNANEDFGLEKERQQQEEELKAKEAGLLRGNPLLNNPTSFNVKRRWDDDVVFKNQTRGESKTPKRFINDTIRNDFHRKFLQKYMK